MNGRVVLYGSAGSNSDEVWRYCYGVNGNMDVFARISAPKLFNVDISNYYTIWQTGTFPVVAEVCAAASTPRSKRSASPGSEPLSISSGAHWPTLSGANGSITAPGLTKRGNFLSSLLCPKSPADLSQVPSCPLCSSDFDTLKKTRFAPLVDARADTCIYIAPADGEQICTPATIAASKRNEEGVIQRLNRPSLSKRDDKVITAKVGNTLVPLPFGKYAGCGDAMDSGNIMKNIVYTNNAHACTVDFEMLSNSELRTLNSATASDQISVETDHVFEPQTLVGFVEFLSQGPNKVVGSYRLPSPEWVMSVVLGISVNNRPVFDFDTSVLNFNKNMGEQALFVVWGYGIGRSDGNQGFDGAVTKARGESHLVLTDSKVNIFKGVWFRRDKATPDGVVGRKVGEDRMQLRNAAGVFSYLRWAPNAPVSGATFTAVQPVWHKWMRVANWIDFVCAHADQQIPWQQWNDGPVNNNGGTPSLRALWANYIETTLSEIEGRAAAWSQQAAADYKKWHGTRRGEPNWYQNAFGPGGFATAAMMRFPRVPTAGWGQFGAFANPSMTFDGAGNSVNLRVPDKIV